MPDYRKKFGDFLRKRRHDAGFTQAEFARYIGESRSNYNAIERGFRKCWQTPGRLTRVSASLGLCPYTADYDEFFILARGGRMPPYIEDFMRKHPSAIEVVRSFTTQKCSDTQLRRVLVKKGFLRSNAC